ncbi:putative membrane protein [Bradyrhizobium elkanii]
MEDAAPSDHASGASARNIEAILRIEKEDEEQLLLHHRALHAVGRFVGTPYFFAIQSCGVGLWLWINTLAPKAGWHFDEYPFPLLSLVLALEAVLLTSCVLIRQNISDRAFERRNHLELQINLLAERESTLSLALLQRIAAHLKCPVENDAQCEELADETEVDEIAHDLRAQQEAGDESVR